MKLGSFLICLLMASFSSIVSYAQDTLSLFIEETYTIEHSGTLEKCEIHIPVPRDYYKRQSIKNIQFSGSAYYSKIGNSTYAVYELSGTDLERYSYINAIIEIDIFDYDLTVAKKNGSAMALKKGQRRTYLRKTGYYKLPKEKLDSNLISQSSNIVEKTQKIHEFVVNHVHYQDIIGKSKGAAYALEEGKGGHKEYADLMTALLRYNKIPARRVSGFTLKMDTSSNISSELGTSEHAWVEVYFNDLGWVPFDPGRSDGNTKINFNNLTNKYIYLRFDELDKGISWKRWGLGQIQIKLDRKVRLKN